MSLLLLLTGLTPAAAGPSGPDQAAVGAGDTVAPGTVRVRNIPLYGFRSFARTGDTFWIESGDVVPFSGAGTELGRVPGLEQSVGITANEDESVLYSASWDDHSITAVDPDTRSILHHWSVEPYPQSIAAAGRYVFYSYLRGVAVLDLDTGSSERVLDSHAMSVLELRGSSLLVRGDSTLSTYSVDGTTLTPLATRSMLARTWALSPNGTEVLVTTTDPMGVATVHRLKAGTLATTLSSGVGVEVDAVAWSPDGTRFALGLSTQGPADVVRVFDAASNLLVSRSRWPGAVWPQTQTLGTLAFSRSQPVVVGFGGHSRQTLRAFVTASTLPGIGTGLTLTTTRPKVYGKPLHAVVRATGCVAPCVVRFTLDDAVAGTRTFSRTLTSGSLTMDLAVKGNGRLRASTPADLRRLPTTSTRPYQVPAKLVARLTGSYRLSGTTAVYSGRRPTVRVAVAPTRRVAVRVTTQWKFDGRWTTASTRIVYTNSRGVVTVRSNWSRNSRHRLVLRVLGDDVVGTSTAVVTRPMRRR